MYQSAVADCKEGHRERRADRMLPDVRSATPNLQCAYERVSSRPFCARRLVRRRGIPMEWAVSLVSNAAGGVGEVEPDFDAAEGGAFGADGGGDVGAEVAGGADVFCELGMDLAELGDFVHARGVDFFLGVEAGAHGPFVEEMEEGAGFDETDGFGVGEQIESDFGGDAFVDKFILGGPGVLHGAVVEFFGAGILGEEGGGDVVGIAGVSES